MSLLVRFPIWRTHGRGPLQRTRGQAGKADLDDSVRQLAYEVRPEEWRNTEDLHVHKKWELNSQG